MRLGTELVEYAIKHKRPPSDTAWQPHIGAVVSNDADFIPAVELAGDHGLATVAVGWRSRGGNLSSRCKYVVWLEDIRQSISIQPGCPQSPV